MSNPLRRLEDVLSIKRARFIKRAQGFGLTREGLLTGK